MANTKKTPNQWQGLIEQQASSGLTIVTFCKQQQITLSSFYAWRKRLLDTSLYPSTTPNSPGLDENKTDWVNIMPELTVPSPSWDIEVALPNGVVLRMMNR